MCILFSWTLHCPFFVFVNLMSGFYFPHLICGFVRIDFRIEMILNPRSSDSWLVGYLLGLYMYTNPKVFTLQTFHTMMKILEVLD